MLVRNLIAETIPSRRITHWRKRPVRGQAAAIDWFSRARSGGLRRRFQVEIALRQPDAAEVNAGMVVEPRPAVGLVNGGGRLGRLRIFANQEVPAEIELADG